MTLDETLLRKLNEWQPAGEGRQSFALVDADSGTAVRLAVDRRDALSCELWEVTLTRSAQAVAKERALRDWADRVVNRVTGLLEVLKVLEFDQDRGQVLLRSEQPAVKQADRLYYEVLLQRTGTASVRRYKGSTQQSQRERVSFVLTQEALAKLVKDLAADQ